MNVPEWIDYYKGNRGTFEEPDWDAPCVLPDHIRRELVRSLAIFQLGESGEGRTVRRYAEKRKHLRELDGYGEALVMFIDEEKFHAAMLAKGVRYLGGPLIEKQWSDSCFCKLRHLVNLEFSIQVLVTAELLGLGYYANVRRYSGDPVIESLCSRLVRDEVRHIAFHIDFLRERLREVSRVFKTAWSLQFRTLFAVVQRVVWHDHGRCLGTLGVKRRSFLTATRRSAEWFVRRVVENVPRTRDPATVSRGVEALAP